jgi:EmrB/QacA subfamily drug resistance transporter
VPSDGPNNIAPKTIEPEVTELRTTGLKTGAPLNIAPIMFGLMLSLFLANLDQTIIATCLSAIAHDLSGWELLPWVISAYLVTSTATTPIYGRLSDLYGRRLVLLASIVIFVLASALCALANTMPLLIAARALQGIGGGGLRSITQVVIADIIPPRNRGKYQGYMSTTFLISTTLGPVLGGFFAEHLSWQWAFWINLPLGAIAFLVINKQLRLLKLPTKRQSIDWAGALLILAAAVPLMFGISQVEETGGWLNQAVLVPILLGAIATALLIVVELRVASPMLPMRLFANKIFTLGNVGLFAPSMVMTALIIILPLYYQIVLKRPADAAGLQLIALTGGMAVGSFIVGSAIAKFGRAKIFPIIGGLVAASVCLVIAREGLGQSIMFDAVCTVLLGAGLGWQINPLLVIVQNGLEIRDIGTGVSGMTFFRSLAGAFGVAMFSTFLIASLGAGAMRVPGHEKLGANPGIGLLRNDTAGVFDAVQTAAFHLVMENAFAAVFVLAAGLCLVAAVVVAIIPARPLRADSGRL